VADLPLQVQFLYAINPDCSPIGVAGVRVVEAPSHGKLTIDKGTGFTSYPQDNPRQACNRRRSDGMLVHYQPEAEYLGPDSVTIDVVFGDGGSRKWPYAIAVNAKPAPFEATRVAVAGQEVRIGFLTNVDPDCSSGPFPTVRMSKDPCTARRHSRRIPGSPASQRTLRASSATSRRAAERRSSIVAKTDMPARTR
jgi:hypothetical protein